MRIVLTPQEYDDFVAVLEGPPRQCPKLVKLLSQETPWAEEEEDTDDSL